MHRKLLTTKLHIPRARPDLVPRPRLFALLDEGMARKLTLICAPAGFGKTTLLSEWQARSTSCRLSVAWLSLDEGDNDPNRFWAYFARALENLQAGVGSSTVALLHAMPPPSIESVLTSLINAAAAIPVEFALVLDDYHVISSEQIHHGLTFLLDHLTPQLHLVIATRNDPPLPLARLRARGMLTELRAADLRFTSGEVASFLNEVMSLGLSADDVSTLESHTEGWIAGLQLAALSMQKEQDIPRFVRAFSGTHRYVVDFLADEVLRRQPVDVQDFLLQTSILERLSGPLCDAVTGQENGQAMIEMLERANLFTMPLDNERRWYRYHPLFADFLRSTLRQREPAKTKELQRRACDWHERNGLAATAIDYALAAGDLVPATRLIEKTAQGMLTHGEVNTLLNWLEALPGELVRSRLRLCLAKAWASALASRFDAVEPCLQQALEALQPTLSTRPGDEREIEGLLGEVTAIRATVATMQQDVPRIIELSNDALRELPQSNLIVRSYIALNLGAAYRLSGDEALAMRGFAEAATLGQAAGNLLVSLVAISSLAQVYARQGHLHRAADLHRYALRLADEHSEGSLCQPRCLACAQLADGRESRPISLAGLAHVGLARLLYEMNDLDAATHHASTGIQLGRQWASVEILQDGYIILARVRQARGSAQGALEAMMEMERLAQQHNLTYRDAQVAAAHARLRILQGDLAAAAFYVEQCLLSTKQYEYLVELAHIAQTRLFIAQGRSEEALSLCERLLRAAERVGRTGSVIEILALQALALHAKNSAHQAMAALGRALALAEPEGYVRVFVDEGAPMAALLARLVDRRIEGITGAEEDATLDYLGKLMAAFGPALTTAPGECPISTPKLLTEPLSKRELEVLQMVASGLSNTEIAQELVVALSTVKSHTNTIFAKLNVRSRMQAVARAKVCGLLS